MINGLGLRGLGGKKECAFFLLLYCFFTVPAFADEVILELQRRSNIPLEELSELLKDCQRTQLNMNICSFRNFIKEELEMKKVLEEKLESLPESCRTKLIKQQIDWERSRDERCNKKADEEAEGGSMRPMIFTSCQAKATESHISKLRAMVGCSSLK